jgi:hypothetical protein
MLLKGKELDLCSAVEKYTEYMYKGRHDIFSTIFDGFDGCCQVNFCAFYSSYYEEGL